MTHASVTHAGVTHVSVYHAPCGRMGLAVSSAGFTLLEVVIALAILSVSLFVLIDSQATAVFMTVDAEKTLTGTYLAQEKMAEAMLRVEEEGFRESSIDEEGDFEELGATEGAGGGAGDGPDFGSSFDGYQWAYTIREVDIQIGDIGAAAGELQSSGYGGMGEESSAEEAPEQRDLTDVGIQPDMISELLRPYIREVRVLVWWGEKEPDLDEGCDDCIELVSHLVNPTGVVVPGSGTAEEAE